MCTSWWSQRWTWRFTLELTITNHQKCIKRWQKWRTWRLDDALDGALEGTIVIEIENSIEGASESTPKGLLWDLFKDDQEGQFQVEIKGVIEVKNELHLKMRMMVHLLRHFSVQNDSINRQTWGDTLCCI